MLCDKLKVYVPQDGPWGLKPEEGGTFVEEETCYLKSEVDAAIAELKAASKESEEARYEAGADAADYYQENRRLKRALWIARAEKAYTEYFLWNHLAFDKKYAQCKFTKEHCNVTKSETNKVARTPREWADIWYDVEYKCRAKAEEYK